MFYLFILIVSLTALHLKTISCFSIGLSKGTILFVSINSGALSSIKTFLFYSVNEAKRYICVNETKFTNFKLKRELLSYQMIQRYHKTGAHFFVQTDCEVCILAFLSYNTIFV